MDVNTFFRLKALVPCFQLGGGPLDFGAWLGEKRREANLTLRELAKKSGLSLPYVAGLERGTSEAPPLRTCKALARVFGIQSEEVWQRAFTARLERWLKSQGYSHVPGEALLEISKKIEEAEKQAR